MCDAERFQSPSSISPIISLPWPNGQLIPHMHDTPSQWQKWTRRAEYIQQMGVFIFNRQGMREAHKSRFIPTKAMQVYTAQKHLYNSLLMRLAHAQAHTQTEVVVNAFISAFSSEDRGAEARVDFGPVLDDEGRTGRCLRTSSMSPQDQQDEPSKTTTTVATTKATMTTTTGAHAGSLRSLPPFSPPGWLWLCPPAVRLSLLFMRSDVLPLPLFGARGKSPVRELSFFSEHTFCNGHSCLRLRISGWECCSSSLQRRVVLLLADSR